MALVTGLVKLKQCYGATIAVFYKLKNSSHRVHRGHRENPLQRFDFSTQTILATHFPLLRRFDLPMKPGDFGEDCLSAKREFRSRPASSANRGKSEGPVQWGALLFGYVLLGKQENVTCRRATPGQSRLAKCYTARLDSGICIKEKDHCLTLFILQCQPPFDHKSFAEQDHCSSDESRVLFGLQHGVLYML